MSFKLFKFVVVIVFAAAVWNWLKEWFQDPDSLRDKLEACQAEQGRANIPVLTLLQTNDALLTDHRVQLARVKQMCEVGIYTIEESIDRTHRLEETITRLEHERGELQRRIVHGLSEDDVENLVAFAQSLAAGLEEADKDFARRDYTVAGTTQTRREFADYICCPLNWLMYR